MISVEARTTNVEEPLVVRSDSRLGRIVGSAAGAVALIYFAMIVPQPWQCLISLLAALPVILGPLCHSVTFDRRCGDATFETHWLGLLPVRRRFRSLTDYVAVACRLHCKPGHESDATWTIDLVEPSDKLTVTGLPGVVARSHPTTFDRAGSAAIGSN